MSKYSFNSPLKNILCEEAESEIRRKIRSGADKEKAIEEVANNLELDEDEIEQIDSNLNDKNTKLETPANANIKENAIFFPSAEDQNNAVGMLMYKSIPWDEKGTCDQGPYIKFANQDATNSARDILKRKWDFVDNDDKKVASISFDNLNDYNKVMSFILKSGMMADFKPVDGLDEDADIEDQQKIKDKTPSTRSFKARRKDVKEVSFKPEKDRAYRNSVIRKRWK